MDARLRRVTDLFVEGKELVLSESGPDGPVVLWINKLNPFERQEAVRDGQAARSRLILALKEVGSDEQAIFEANLGRTDLASVREALLNLQANDLMVDAVREIRADPEWRERLNVVDRGGLDLPPDGSPEREYLDKVNQEYIEEVRRRAEKKRSQAEDDLFGQPEDAVRDSYREAYLNVRGMESFEAAFARTQLFFSVRECSATHDNGRWQHTSCDHTRRWLDERAQVDGLPAALLIMLNQAIREVTMDQSDARFSAGQTTSSEPSRLPDKEEASAPSTPAAMSDEPVGTSS